MSNEAQSGPVVLDQSTFHSFISESQKPVIVDFWATWCGPCMRMAPIFEAIASERTDIVVAKVDVDKAPALAQEFRIMSIPTMILFKDGKPVSTRVGAISKEEVNAGIDQFL